MHETPEYDFKAIQLQKLDDRIIWYGQQSWQVPLVFLGAVGVAVVQVIDMPTVLPWVALVGSIAGSVVLWHMLEIGQNYERLCGDIIRLEYELGVRNREPLKSASQPEGTPGDHRLPLLCLQGLATVGLYFFWALSPWLGYGH